MEQRSKYIKKMRAFISQNKYLMINDLSIGTVAARTHGVSVRCLGFGRAENARISVFGELIMKDDR